MTIASKPDLHAAPRITEAMNKAHALYRVWRHDDLDHVIRRPEDFAKALGYACSRITKTLFLKGRGEAGFFFVVCGMDKRVDLNHLAARLGAGRLEMASLPELHEMVGYPPTSVTPIAVPGIPVLMDEALFSHDTILTGAGVPRVELELSPKTLQDMCNAQSMALT